MVRKIEWTEKLSTEILSLDTQHSMLLEELNAFMEAVERDDPKDNLCALFETMMAETQKHFAFEERIMMNIGFKDFSAHKSHHDALLVDAQAILGDLKAGKNGDEITPTLNFLRALIIKHMVEQDLKIREFVTEGT